MSPFRRRFAVRAATLAAAGAWFVLASIVLAEVATSPHDFSATGPFTQSPALAPRGPCSPCHAPHSAQDNVLWPRPLSAYRSALVERDGSPSTEPNFLRAPAVQCYDCHELHGSGAIEGTPTPALSIFNTSHRPQNILSGFTKTGPGSMTEDGFGGSVAGFYETNPVGSAASHGVDTSAPLAGTGGHFFKYADPDSGGAAFKIGDKLPCRDCHDPHAWNSAWQAFIKPNMGGTVGWSRISAGQPIASNFMANGVPSGASARNDIKSRELCAACHGYSNTTPVNFPDISAQYSNNVAIVGPPGTVGEHNSSSQVACVSCHTHNSIAVTCNGCHSYPGLDNTNSPHLLSAVHSKHVGDSTGFANSRKFDCTICHYGFSPTHNGSGYSAGQAWAADNSWRANVNINFDPGWNPGSPTYHGAAVPTTGGDPPSCAGLSCHGDAGPFAGRKTGTNTTPRWDNAASGACGACHGTGTLMNSANHPVHLDNVAKPFGPWFDNTTCGNGGACHTAYGLSPTATHVDNVVTGGVAVSFRTSAANATPVSLSATGICENCHATATAAFDNGAGSGVGNSLAKQNWSDNTYKLPCTTCHNKTSQAKTRIDGSGNTAPNIELHWLVTGHGASVIDNASNSGVNLVPDPPVYRNVPVPCGMCHNILSSHFATTGKNTVNPWRLRASTSFGNNSAGGFDRWCAETCHSAAPPANHTWNIAAGHTKESWDTHKTSTAIVPDANKFKVPAAEMPLDPFLTNKGYVQSNAAPTDRFLCMTCHDPHGIGNVAAAPRSFYGVIDANGIGNDNVHMLRYDYSAGGSQHCKYCHK